MPDSNRAWKWFMVVIMVALAILIISPPQEKLKGGIDLVGGTSLLYEIDTSDLNSQQQDKLAEQVMEVLKQRVDPGSQKNLEWRPIGNNRLEIRMPQPPQHVLERRGLFNDAMDNLRARNITRAEVEAALDAGDDQRDGLLIEMVRGVDGRSELLATLTKAHDSWLAAEDSDIAADIETTYAAYEAAFRNVLATNFPVDRFKDILAMRPGEKRENQIEKLRTTHGFAEQDLGAENLNAFNAVLAAHAEWSKDSTALEDPADLKRLLKGAGVLEFTILADRDPQSPLNIRTKGEQGEREAIKKYTDQLQTFGPRVRAGARFRWYEVEDISDFMHLRGKSIDEVKDLSQQIIEEYAGKYYVLAHNDPEYMMTGKGRGAASRWKLTYAFPDRDPQTGRNVVIFGMDPKGASFFGDLTGNNIQRQLAIILDDKAMSHATIQDRISERCQISGDFTQERVIYLVRTLQAGALPARLKEPPLTEKTIGPSLGQTNRDKGMSAAIYGGIAVALFVLFYYGLTAGSLADLALALNLLFVLAAMALMQATFTLPGIAGLILTVGMAIDANVLIFERFREERDRGIIFKKAINSGYDKAMSTIVDANLTTLITCVILGMVSSEEVKGFAIVLGLGIATSMFTSLFVTRLVFNTLIHRGLLKDLSMRRIIHNPNVDWVSLRSYFWPVSMIVVVCGVLLFGSVSAGDKEAIYDIEFLGGTSVQIDLKPGENFKGTEENLDEQVADAITLESWDHGLTAVGWLNQASETLKSENPAVSTSVGQTGEYALSVPGKYSGDQLASLMSEVTSDLVERDGVYVEGQQVSYTFKDGKIGSLDAFKALVDKAGVEAASVAENLRKARVQEVVEAGSVEGVERGRSFEVVTVETNRDLVQSAIIASLSDKLDLQRSVRHSIVRDDVITLAPYFAIQEDQSRLSEVLGRDDTTRTIPSFKGGVAIHIKLDDTEDPMTPAELESRIREVRLRPEFEQYGMRQSDVISLGLPETRSDGELGYRELVYVAVDDNLRYDDEEVRWAKEVAEVELAVVEGALSSERSLSKVIKFDKQISGQTQQNTIFAIILALGAIVAYVWLRFGTMQYGLAAIVALVHDVSITLGMVTLTHYIYSWGPCRLLGLSDFKIDLPMIAAILTVIGYSLNDTIVVFDRIRENRGRLGALSPAVINSSINQTLSRTLLTSVTTFLVVLVMFIWGGEGIKGFSYALLIGVVVGTYSSIGVATPLLYKPRLLFGVAYAIAALALIGVIFTVVGGGTWAIVLSVVVLAIVAYRAMKTDKRLVTAAA